MKIVLLFFCGILILISMVCLLLIFSKIKLNIKKISISNIKAGRKQKDLSKEFEIYLELYLLGFIKIARIKVNKKLAERFKVKQELESIQTDVKIVKSINHLEIIKKLKIRTEKFRMYLALGTESVMLTVNLIAIISAICGIAFRNLEPTKTEYRVIPLYNFGNSIKFNLNCIISVKIVHIIYVIYILSKKRRNKHERASDRGTYDYSYE